MKKITIYYKDGSTETFEREQNNFPYWTIDMKLRCIYISQSDRIFRIPFESIKKIEEVRNER